MKELALSEIVKCIDGDFIQGSTDLLIKHATRWVSEIGSNTVYFNRRPKRNDNVDWKSVDLSHAAVVTDNPSFFLNRVDPETVIVKVKSVKEAYWKFVQYYRSLFDIPVIAITGTCGKTTTTEMIKHILSSQYRISSTYDGRNGTGRNFRYLLSIDEKTEAAVFELGLAYPGDNKLHCEYFQPNVGVILNIGVYHLLGCKTFDSYVQAKGEIVQGLAPDGTLILNADDENIKRINLASFKGKVVYFGCTGKADFRTEDSTYSENGIKFTLYFQNKAYPVSVPGFGKHNVYNALAAIASVFCIGVEIKEAVERLSSFQPVRRHLEFRTGKNGSTIIDDTWNCTPPSVKAALEVLKDTANRRKTVAVLGLMPQLGEAGMDEYDKIASTTAEENIDHLILIGEAKKIGIKALEIGLDKNRVVFCETAEEVYDALSPFLNRKSIILLKYPYHYCYRNYPSFQEFMARIFL